MGFVAESRWDSRRVISQCPSPQTEVSWVSRTGNTQAPWCPFSLRLCPPGSDIKGRNEMGFAGADKETFQHELPRYTQSPNTPCHPFNPSAQPLQGCCVIGHLPMVAPRRCNHGLCGRIPLGFPEGGFPMPIPAFAGSPPHLRSSAPSVDNPSPFACIGVHSRFVPSLWAPVLALRAGCKPSVPPGTPSTNTHPCKAGPVISIRQTFFPLPEFNPTPLDPPEYHIPPTGHSWIARTSMLTSEAPGWSRTRHSWQHSAG